MSGKKGISPLVDSYVIILGIQLDRLRQHTINMKQIHSEGDTDGLKQEWETAKQSMAKFSSSLERLRSSRHLVSDSDIGLFDHQVQTLHEDAMMIMEACNHLASTPSLNMQAMTSQSVCVEEADVITSPVMTSQRSCVEEVNITAPDVRSERACEVEANNVITAPTMTSHKACVEEGKNDITAPTLTSGRVGVEEANNVISTATVTSQRTCVEEANNVITTPVVTSEASDVIWPESVSITKSAPVDVDISTSTMSAQQHQQQQQQQQRHPQQQQSRDTNTDLAAADTRGKVAKSASYERQASDMYKEAILVIECSRVVAGQDRQVDMATQSERDGGTPVKLDTERTEADAITRHVSPGENKAPVKDGVGRNVFLDAVTGFLGLTTGIKPSRMLSVGSGPFEILGALDDTMLEEGREKDARVQEGHAQAEQAQSDSHSKMVKTYPWVKISPVLDRYTQQLRDSMEKLAHLKVDIDPLFPSLLAHKQTEAEPELEGIRRSLKRLECLRKRVELPDLLTFDFRVSQLYKDALRSLDDWLDLGERPTSAYPTRQKGDDEQPRPRSQGADDTTSRKKEDEAAVLQQGSRHSWALISPVLGTYMRQLRASLDWLHHLKFEVDLGNDGNAVMQRELMAAGEELKVMRTSLENMRQLRDRVQPQDLLTFDFMTDDIQKEAVMAEQKWTAVLTKTLKTVAQPEEEEEGEEEEEDKREGDDDEGEKNENKEEQIAAPPSEDHVEGMREGLAASPTAGHTDRQNAVSKETDSSMKTPEQGPHLEGELEIQESSRQEVAPYDEKATCGRVDEDKELGYTGNKGDDKEEKEAEGNSRIPAALQLSGVGATVIPMVIGGALGTIVAGPIGLVAGLKMGSMAGLGGGIVGATGTVLFKNEIKKENKERDRNREGVSSKMANMDRQEDAVSLKEDQTRSDLDIREVSLDKPELQITTPPKAKNLVTSQIGHSERLPIRSQDGDSTTHRPLSDSSSNIALPVPTECEISLKRNACPSAESTLSKVSPDSKHNKPDAPTLTLDGDNSSYDVESPDGACKMNTRTIREKAFSSSSSETPECDDLMSFSETTMESSSPSPPDQCIPSVLSPHVLYGNSCHGADATVQQSEHCCTTLRRTHSLPVYSEVDLITELLTQDLPSNISLLEPEQLDNGIETEDSGTDIIVLKPADAKDGQTASLSGQEPQLVAMDTTMKYVRVETEDSEVGIIVQKPAEAEDDQATRLSNQDEALKVAKDTNVVAMDTTSTATMHTKESDGDETVSRQDSVAMCDSNVAIVTGDDDICERTSPSPVQRTSQEDVGEGRQEDVETSGGDDVEESEAAQAGGMFDVTNLTYVKAATLPVIGMVLGGAVLGPVGLVAGFKAGSMAAVGGGIIGATSGTLLKKQQEKEEEAMKEEDDIFTPD